MTDFSSTLIGYLAVIGAPFGVAALSLLIW